MIDTSKIKALLEKYFSGDTSLEEEALLQKYFNNADIAPELNMYKGFFKNLLSEREVVLENNISEKIKNEILRNKNLKIFQKPFSKNLFRAAAVFIFLSGASYFFLKSNTSKNEVAQHFPSKNHKAKVIVLDGTEDPRYALETIKSALTLTSENLKKGSDCVNDGFKKLNEATSVLK